jgi:hypothetical protein
MSSDENNVVLTKATIISKPFGDDLFRVSNSDELTSGMGSSINGSTSSSFNTASQNFNFFDHAIKSRKNYEITTKQPVATKKASSSSSTSSSSASNNDSALSPLNFDKYITSTSNNKKDYKRDDNIIMDVNKN